MCSIAHHTKHVICTTLSLWIHFLCIHHKIKCMNPAHWPIPSCFCRYDLVKLKMYEQWSMMCDVCVICPLQLSGYSAYDFANNAYKVSSSVLPLIIFFCLPPCDPPPPPAPLILLLSSSFSFSSSTGWVSGGAGPME